MTLYPELPEFTDLKIRLLVKDKNLPEALRIARDAHEKWPDNPDMAFLLGSILDETGNKKDAMAIMEQLIEKQPDNFQALNYVGFTLAEENREIDRALNLLTRANDLAPNQAFIQDSLAWALYRANRLEEALKQIKQATSGQDALDPAIWEHYGDIASKLNKKDEARRAYRKALELKPDNASVVRDKLAKL